MPSDLQSARAEVRVLVLTGLGLNCEDETAEGFRLCGAHVEHVHLSDLLDESRNHRLDDYHILSLVGGFAFGDHIAAGVVYANRLRYRAMDRLLRFVDDGGLVLGICNGFQTMVKLGLVPALDGKYSTQQATLAANDRLGYRDAWVTVRAEPASPCVWTKGIGKMDLPARHGEGKFIAESDEVLARIEAERLVALRYVDDHGEPTQQWPQNPNGSVNAIAGVCDPTGRLLGLMPHPDAFLYGFSHPAWPRRLLHDGVPKDGDGLLIFRNGVDHVARRMVSGQDSAKTGS